MCPYSVPNFSHDIGLGILPSGCPTISYRLMILAAAARGRDSGMSPFMLSSTWWLNWGGSRFPLASSKTPALMESAIVILNSACSSGVDGASNVNFGRYFLGSSKDVGLTPEFLCQLLLRSCYRLSV